MAAIEHTARHTARRGGPIDRDQLRALRALRAAFGDVQVLSVDDNTPDSARVEQLRMAGAAS
jgi:hypothetical protein